MRGNPRESPKIGDVGKRRRAIPAVLTIGQALAATAHHAVAVADLRRVVEGLEGLDGAVRRVHLDFDRLQTGVLARGEADRSGAEGVCRFGSRCVAEKRGAGDGGQRSGDGVRRQRDAATGVLCAAENLRALRAVHVADGLVERIDQGHAVDDVALIAQRGFAENAGGNRLFVFNRRAPGGGKSVHPRAVENPAGDGGSADPRGAGDAFEVDRGGAETVRGGHAGELAAGGRQVRVPGHDDVARVVGEVDRATHDRHDARAEHAIAVVGDNGLHGFNSSIRSIDPQSRTDGDSAVSSISESNRQGISK